MAGEPALRARYLPVCEYIIGRSRKWRITQKRHLKDELKRADLVCRVGPNTDGNGVAGNRGIGEREDWSWSIPRVVPVNRDKRNWLAYVACGGMVLAWIAARLLAHKAPNCVNQEGTPSTYAHESTQKRHSKSRPVFARHQDNWHPEEKRHRGREWWYWRLTIALSSITTIGAIAAAYFAGQAYGQAKRQADIAQASLIDSSRAWLAPRWARLDAPIEVGKPIIVTEEFANIGREPALHSSALGKLYLVSAPQNTQWADWNNPAPNECESGKEFGHGGVVFPTTDQTSGFTMSSKDMPIAWFAAIGWISAHPHLDPAQEIINRDFILVANVCLSYWTARESHASKACYYLVPHVDKPVGQWQFASCPNGNDAN